MPTSSSSSGGSSSYLRRGGLVAGFICLFLAIAYQYTRTEKVALRTAAASMTRAPVIALSHGGGPMPLLNDPSHKDIIASLSTRVPRLLGLGTPSAPRAIVLVTAHWTTRHPVISSGARHPLLYDYYGFPPETYSLSYPAPGSPSVADEVKAAMESEGLRPALDPTRGWDHGVFVPMLLINPAADVPVVQISVLASEDPAEHLAMGRALSALRDTNVAVVGSGFASFHNLRKMGELMRGDPATLGPFKARSAAWNEGLGRLLVGRKGGEGTEGLKAWREMSDADEMHPRGGGEHFMPLLVCAGAAREDEVGKGYKDEFLGIDVWTYHWGTKE